MLPVRVERGHSFDLDSGRQELGHLLNRLFWAGPGNGLETAAELPPLLGYGVDIREDADHIYVEADMPGFRKEDVTVTLQDGTLTIAAARREETEAPAASDPKEQQGSGARAKSEYLLRERRIQRVVRSFTLPPNVEEQNVQAALENGVLKITLSKRDGAKPKQIQVR